MLQPTFGFPLILRLLVQCGEPGGQRHQPNVEKVPIIGVTPLADGARMACRAYASLSLRSKASAAGADEAGFCPVISKPSLTT